MSCLKKPLSHFFFSRSVKVLSFVSKYMICFVLMVVYMEKRDQGSFCFSI